MVCMSVGASTRNVVGPSDLMITCALIISRDFECNSYLSSTLTYCSPDKLKNKSARCTAQIWLVAKLYSRSISAIVLVT